MYIYLHLGSVQKDLWSNIGRTKLAFISFATATISLICIKILIINYSFSHIPIDSKKNNQKLHSTIGLILEHYETKRTGN